MPVGGGRAEEEEGVATEEGMSISSPHLKLTRGQLLYTITNAD